VGLDVTEGQVTLKEQEQFLHKFLSNFVTTNRPLVLHVRGDNSPVGRQLFERCLDVVREHCGVGQPIHLHCFSGNARDVAGWLGYFRKCYFGFTKSAQGFSREQILGLKQVPKDRILLETDSPYLCPVSGQVNTPRFVGDVGRLVAEKREENWDKLMELCYRNTIRLYKFEDIIN